MQWYSSRGACGTTRLFGGIHEKRKHHHDFIRELAGVVRILDHRLENDVDERTYHGLRDGMFNEQDFEAQGERAPRRGCHHGVLTKQRRQLISAP